MLFETLRKNIDLEKVEIIEKDLHINDEEYALALAKKMIELIEEDN
jgi:uncharacterized protein (UPF0261 family)